MILKWTLTTTSFFPINLFTTLHIYLRHVLPIIMLPSNIAQLACDHFVCALPVITDFSNYWKTPDNSYFAYTQGWLLRCVTYVVVTQGPTFRRSAHLVKCSAVTVLKFIIILSVNLCFVSEVQRGNGMSRYSCVRCSLPPHLHRTFLMLREHRIPVDPTWQFSGTQSK